MTTAPSTVNGYEVIAQMETPKAPMTRAGRVIVVDRGEGNTCDRYVTGWHGQENGAWDQGWSSGHYFSDKPSAMRDFSERCQRQY